MISTLVSGTLIGKPVQRASRDSGRTFVTGQIRVSADGDSFLVSLISFNQDICQSLLALDKNDAVSIAGPGKPSTWIGKDGSPAIGLSIVVQQLMTAYRLREKRKAINASKESYLPAQSPLLDSEGDVDGALF
jgi:hypothetical protein